MASSSRLFQSARSVTLITGANRGLGFELARLLVRLGGYHVIASARSWRREAGSAHNHLLSAQDESQRMASRRSGELSFVEMDVGAAHSRLALQGALARVLGTEQRLNVLVNNAGVYVDGWSPEALASSMAANASGPLRLAAELAPFYAPDAHVINVSSGYGRLRELSPHYRSALAGGGLASIEDIERAAAFVPTDAQGLGSAASASASAGAGSSAASASAFAYVPAYKVSKAALCRGTQVLAKEFKKGGVRVNALDPGWCSTDM